MTRVWKTIVQVFSVSKGVYIIPTKIDVNWWHSTLILSSLNESHIQNFSSILYVNAHRKKWKTVTVYFQYSKFQKGHNFYKNWHSNLVWCSFNESHNTKFQLNMPKHVGEKKSRKLCIFSILSSKMGHNSYKNWHTLTTLKIDL